MRHTVAPTWEETPEGAQARFAAIPLRMRTLVALILVTVLAGGIGAALLVIALDGVLLRAGARVTVIAVGVLIALPAYAVLRALLRRRTVTCRIAMAREGLILEAGAMTLRMAYADVDEIVWRPSSDYARVEVRGAGVDVSLLVGLARPLAGRSATLPGLAGRLPRLLERAGLSLVRSRRGDVSRFVRSAAVNAG